MDWYEAEVTELVRRLATQTVAAPVVFYGSSTITLWDTLATDVACARAVNAGFGGSTLEACGHFFERIVPPLRPASIVVYAGDNDLGDGRSPDDVITFFRGLARQVERLSTAPIPFGFISIKPSPARVAIFDHIRSTNERMREEIEKQPGGYFVDMFDHMLTDGKPRPELFRPDGLHMNRTGYELWMRLLAPFHDRFCPPPITLTPVPTDTE